MSSSQLIWQLVKNNNSFLHKGLNGINLSKEPGNLYNLHSYKHSGIANDRVIHIESENGNLKISKKISKNSNKPSKAQNSSSRKKSFQRITSGLETELNGYRPDLKKAALAKASAVKRSTKSRKPAKKE